jgi:hypothetical protein
MGSSEKTSSLDTDDKAVTFVSFEATSLRLALSVVILLACTSVIWATRRVSGFGWMESVDVMRNTTPTTT